MPSMSGTTAASSYSEDKKHPNLTGKGKSSSTPSSSKAASVSETDSQKGGSARNAKQAGSNNMDRGIAGAQSSGASPSKHSANKQGLDNMGGGSSAIFSQGPNQGGSEQDSKGPSNGSGPQGDASTPAMPSMSGTGAATSYSDNAKHKSLSGHTSGGSRKPGITRNPTSSSSGLVNNPTSSDAGSDNMGGGSSAIYSQGPKQGGREGESGGSEGDASTPAMPSMSGSGAASMYADRANKAALSGTNTSATAIATTRGSNSHKSAAGDTSGSTTDHISGQNAITSH